MRRRGSRVAIAALATCAAMGLPCAAWYVAGSRAARAEAARIEQAPLLAAREEAERIARGVALRLEALRHSESRRSVLDYAEHPHGWGEACSCSMPVRSPLAEGPADPLVWAHFQIDEVGQLSLPTLAVQPAATAPHATQAEQEPMQRAILEQIECAVADRLTGRGGQTLARMPPGPDLDVGVFRWHTVTLDDDTPALVALRDVLTPRAVLAQGFVIRADALETLAHSTTYRARVEPGAPASGTEVAVPIDGAPWRVGIDASIALGAARDRARGVTRAFYRMFAGGLLAALLASGLVIGLVYQTEILARDRARFAAAAAHELRTPLAGLRLYGEMLADDGVEPERGRIYARRIASEAERLGRVVANVLEFTRLERGRFELDCQSGRLAPAIEESVERLRPALEAAGARISTRIAERLPEVSFDRDAVHQIVQNLLDNAERYSRGAADRSLEVALEPAGRGVELSVTDHGPGMRPSRRRGTGSSATGLGLGLTLVTALARAQRASVTHRAMAGGGTRFSVLFPALAD